MLKSLATWISLARLRTSIGRPAAIGAVLFTLLVPLETTADEGLGEPARPFRIGERLTYEVKGKIDSDTYYVYINALTGSQEKILLIVETPDGSRSI